VACERVKPTECVGKWNQFSVKLKTTASVNWVLGAFVKLRKATVNFVTSVRPHGTARLPLGGFS